MKTSPLEILVSFLVLLAIVAIYNFIIMIIWNKVIIKKFPNADIQKLSFWDSLALAVFFGLLTGGTTVVYTCKDYVGGLESM